MYLSIGVSNICLSAHKIIDNSDTKKLREESRIKQTQRINKGLWKPEVFKPGETVYLRDQDGHWKIPAVVRSQRKHQGFDTPSYVLKNISTGTTTTRIQRDIRRFPGDANQTADATNITADTEKVITGIMKQNECMKDPESQETADNTEQSARGESSGAGINPAHTDTSSHSSLLPEVCHPSFRSPTFEDQACSLQAQGPIAWAKTVQVIYYQEPKV